MLASRWYFQVKSRCPGRCAVCFRAVLEAVWRTLFPPRCLGCGVHGQAVCGRCAQTLPYLPPRVCHRCASPGPRRTACRACARLSPALARVRAVFAYEGVARRAVHAFKFRSGRYLAPLLGTWLRANLEQRPMHADLVVPVPLAPGRLRERGYNQAALLAEQVVPLVGGPLAAALLERADRPPQQTLTANQRLANLHGAIRCRDHDHVRGKTVLVMDDVMTTGATLSACADALTEAGARRVIALVF